MTTQSHGSGYPDAWPPPPRGGVPRWAIAVIATALVVIVGLGVVVVLALLPGDAAASEVTREPVATAGTNPFMPAVGTDATGVTAPAGTGGTVRADTAGLYGGTRDDATCDGRKLVRFLGSHPGEAAAWSGVLGIRTSDIGSYVAGLTPVVLRSDTLVTNHGYAAGRATVVSSVLQAGSAVFVDVYGSPVVRCACGNPLTAPSLLRAPVYVGPTWVSFRQTDITIVQSSTTIINEYTLVDPWQRRPFTRPSRSDGSRDADSTYRGEASRGPTTGGGAGGDTSTGPSTGSSTAPPAGDPDAPFDPRNADYSVSCASGPVPVRQGHGSAGGATVRVAATSSADLTGDGRDDTAVLLECSSGSGEPTQDVQVLDADGNRLGSVGPPQPPAGSTGTPRFEPSTFTLSPGSLRTGMGVFAPTDTATPSLSQTWTWDWDGSAFTLDRSSVTPVETSDAPAPALRPDAVGGVDAVSPDSPTSPESPTSPSSPIGVPQTPPSDAEGADGG